MKPKILLRIASILIFIHSILHTYGVSTWKDSTDPIYNATVKQMAGHKFPFMGATHSLADYYLGFAYSCSVALLLIAIILWMISGEVDRSTALVKKIGFSIGIALAAWGTIEIICFFPFAATVTLTATVSTLVASTLLRKTT